MRFGPHFVLGVFFFLRCKRCKIRRYVHIARTPQYQTLCTQFRIIPPSFTPPPPFEGTPGKYVNSAPQDFGCTKGYTKRCSLSVGCSGGLPLSCSSTSCCRISRDMIPPPAAARGQPPLPPGFAQGRGGPLPQKSTAPKALKVLWLLWSVSAKVRFGTSRIVRPLWWASFGDRSSGDGWGRRAFWGYCPCGQGLSTLPSYTRYPAAVVRRCAVLT